MKTNIYLSITLEYKRRDQKWRVDQIKKVKRIHLVPSWIKTTYPRQNQRLPLWYINKTQIKMSQLFKSLLKKGKKKRFSDIVAVWAINHSHKEEEEQEKIFRFLCFLVISRSFLSPSLAFLPKIKERDIALRCDSDRMRERERERELKEVCPKLKVRVFFQGRERKRMERV